MNPAGALVDLIAGRETDGWIELRWFNHATGHPNQEWYRCNDWGRDKAASEALRLSAHGDVFIGCAPRVERGDGGKQNVARAWCLWVDCDTPEAAAKLAQFKPQPTLTIASGTGTNVHGWWSLAGPVPSRWIEKANRRLAHHLGADPRCAEVARILRPPGTRNWKHDPPAAVTIVGGNPGHVRLVEMVASLPDPPARRPEGNPAPRRVPTDDPLLGISAQEYVPRLTGRDIDGKGYVQCVRHDDWRPSLMCYADPKRGFYCFQCGWGGTVYDFGSALYGIPTSGSAFVQLKERLTRELT